jgi:hypothetical protein
MDCRRLHGLGWRSTMPLAKGLAIAYEDFKTRMPTQ